MSQQHSLSWEMSLRMTETLCSCIFPKLSHTALLQGVNHDVRSETITRKACIFRLHLCMCFAPYSQRVDEGQWVAGKERMG